MSFIGLDRIISVWTSLDTAWTVLGHVLGHAWFGLLACPEAARRVLGGNRGEGEAMLDGAGG